MNNEHISIYISNHTSVNIVINLFVNKMKNNIYHHLKYFSPRNCINSLNNTIILNHKRCFSHNGINSSNDTIVFFGISMTNRISNQINKLRKIKPFVAIFTKNKKRLKNGK
jgi:hypothetical protein